MDPINGLNNIMEILRRQIADNAQRLDRSGKAGRSSISRNEPKAGKPSPHELRALIHDRIKGLDPREPHYRHKAKRLFLESVMAWEFGSNIVRDQEFSELIADIQETLETTPEIERQFDGLIDQLATGRKT